jgi:hypothetical protein
MAYTINLTNGTLFATIADGTINTSSSMVLVGKNYAGYGEFLDENFVHLLESGSNNTAPGAPLTGQLWWDSANGVMKVYNGTIFKVISGATSSGTAPTSAVSGDLWFDTVNQQLKVYNGSAFILVGPASTSGQGTSGAIVTTVVDTLSVSHVIVQLFVQNTLVGMISKDATFTPNPAITGFATISPGIQLSTTVSNNLFRGTATDTQLLDGLDSTQFLRSDANDTTSGTLGILNDVGLTVGLDQDAKISVNTATSDVTIQNQTQNANLIFQVNDGGVNTTVISVNGSSGVVTIPSLSANISGNITVPGSNTQVIFNDSGLANAVSQFTFNKTTGNLTITGNSSVSGNATVGGLLNGGANGAGNIGSSTTYFNTVFAKATSAQYADVAERFAADTEIEPGTVVELGGIAEITTAMEELSENVFGVVSTNAAYLMNAGAGTNKTHPPIAMTGRVPVRVTGKVCKGDRLVSAGNGLARSALAQEATPFNVIGRALEDKINDSVGVVEAIVTIK